MKSCTIAKKSARIPIRYIGNTVSFIIGKTSRDKRDDHSGFQRVPGMSGLTKNQKIQMVEYTNRKRQSGKITYAINELPSEERIFRYSPRF